MQSVLQMGFDCWKTERTMIVKKITRRNFLRAAASSAAAITATMLVGCDDGGSGNSTASNGSYKPGGTGSSEKTENPVEKPADSNESEGSSFIVKGTVRSKEYKTEVETRVDFYIGGTTLRVVDERKIISVVDGRTYTDFIHGVETYTLSKPIQKVQRLGKNLGDSVIFYVPEDTIIKSEYKESDNNGNSFSIREFQWLKTAHLKTDEELTILGDAGRISRGKQVVITGGGMYQLCWANEEDSYAVAGNIVFNIL